MPEQHQSQNLSYNLPLRSMMKSDTLLGLGKHKQMIEMKGQKWTASIQFHVMLL
jgi:hypothetical protein